MGNYGKVNFSEALLLPYQFQKSNPLFIDMHAKLNWAPTVLPAYIRNVAFDNYNELLDELNETQS